ncbi:MAG TPA: pantoate--beta-alanine ligase [Cyclobacteriaceae bacterium]|nr:pantoate--beta-alanine ligase [Cyclobacteriaceae bacterium]
MQIFKKSAQLRDFLKEKRLQNKIIGFVPTMGALHRGHLELIKVSKNQTDLTVCSIFVNQAQFNNDLDFQKYPKNEEQDIELLEEVGCDVLFMPPGPEIYPQKPNITFQLGGLADVLEGRFRPGHFSGVVLVVSKLFHIVSPNYAFFGLKDLQQCLVIRELVNEMMFDVKLVFVPTVREPDGLAMSSRNLRLTPEERVKAAGIYKSLNFARQALLQGKQMAEVRVEIEKQYNTLGIQLEYFELVEFEGLRFLEGIAGAAKPVVCAAAYVGEVRLIDNLFLKD